MVMAYLELQPTFSPFLVVLLLQPLDENRSNPRSRQDDQLLYLQLLFRFFQSGYNKLDKRSFSQLSNWMGSG